MRVQSDLIRPWLVLSVFLALSNCAEKAASRDGGSGEAQDLKLAYAMSPGGPAHDTAQEFAALMARRTNGAVKVTTYPSAQLGRERELVEGLSIGSVDLVLTGPALVGWYAPQYGAIEAPFAFDSYEHLDAVIEGDLGQEIEQALRDSRRLKVLAYWHRGPRYLTTTNRIVKKPEDLNGLKLRVPELPTYIEAWRILGANTTPITYSEMFMALKQGIVEGQENPLEVIYTSSLYEVQKYVMETKHLLSFYILVMADRVFAHLSPETQEAIQVAAQEAARIEHALMIRYEDEYREKLQEAGMKFVEVDREAFRARVTAELPKRFEDTWVPRLWERIRSVSSGS